MKERTFSIIKPDAMRRGFAGQILARLEKEGFTLVGLRLLHMSKIQAEGFYAVHRERSFFSDLTDFMSSGPAIVMVLEKDNAVEDLRDLMGPTNSKEAPEGTLRNAFGTDVEKNAIHGSDSAESARVEISYFFNALELVSR